MGSAIGRGRLLRWLSVFFLLGSACGPMGGELGYQPPGLPLKVSVDTWGEIHFSVEKSVQIPSPLGTFSAGIIIDPATHFSVENTLTVRLNGEDYIYDLHGEDFNVAFEPGYYRQISLSKRGSNLLLVLERRMAGSVWPTRPQNASAARRIPSIWNDLDFRNLTTPGTNTYYKTIAPSTQRWAFSWCGKDSTHFRNILKPFTIRFYIDDVMVSPSDILEYDTNNLCRNWVTILDGWQSGTRVTLDIRYHLSAPIEGGYGIRDIGDYTQRILVTVR